MDFNEYQSLAVGVAIYPNRGENLTYPVLGLCGESGEVAEKVKKIQRDDNGKLSEEKRDLLKKELGDVIWYVAACCSELQLDMEDVAQSNIDKLYDRKVRGVIKGSGDNR
jgi:NTP pyrophosphatase (non-canonical NTP hydrolase)